MYEQDLLHDNICCGGRLGNFFKYKYEIQIRDTFPQKKEKGFGGWELYFVIEENLIALLQSFWILTVRSAISIVGVYLTDNLHKKRAFQIK